MDVLLVRDAVPKLPQFGHYDLLHGSRRLWKNTLESCRLSLIEQKILGITRKDDTPGYLAPMLYFDFLREKDPEIIEGVLLHNEEDMLSLVTLYIHLSNLLLNRLTDDLRPSELYELGRWYEYVGDEEQALYFYKKGLVGQPLEYETKLLLALASLHKKRGEIDRAVDLWNRVERKLEVVPSSLYIELAKVYEHSYKDYQMALQYAMKAFQVWKQENRLLRGKKDREKVQFLKRIERLEYKCI
ncbi:MAG TPA: ribonuclease H-like domain-containing protein [Bacillota bacterium]|nr:ribonuclease H-like domain-containing protein [Bacillota bacterium]